MVHYTENPLMSANGIKKHSENSELSEGNSQGFTSHKLDSQEFTFPEYVLPVHAPPHSASIPDSTFTRHPSFGAYMNKDDFLGAVCGKQPKPSENAFRGAVNKVPPQCAQRLPPPAPRKRRHEGQEVFGGSPPPYTAPRTMGSPKPPVGRKLRLGDEIPETPRKRQQWGNRGGSPLVRRRLPVPEPRVEPRAEPRAEPLPELSASDVFKSTFSGEPINLPFDPLDHASDHPLLSACFPDMSGDYGEHHAAVAPKMLAAAREKLAELTHEHIKPNPFLHQNHADAYEAPIDFLEKLLAIHLENGAAFLDELNEKEKADRLAELERMNAVAELNLAEAERKLRETEAALQELKNMSEIRFINFPDNPQVNLQWKIKLVQMDVKSLESYIRYVKGKMPITCLKMDPLDKFQPLIVPRK